MSLNETPRADRLHVGIFGKRNTGKSSLINALTNQNISLVSDRPGTTTDPVFKSMELHPIGPVVFIDTAGFDDDDGELGALRVEKTAEVMDKTDVAIVIFEDEDFTKEKRWIQKLEAAGIPVIPVIGKSDEIYGESLLAKAIEEELGIEPILVSALRREGMEDIKQAIEKAVPEDFKRKRILGNMVKHGELVMLVMPQDIQAPKGRLILPQVQTIRELLDNKCTTVCTTADGFVRSLKALAKAPGLIITDSQCFKEVYEHKPKESRLTSFSVLFAAYKGDIGVFTKGADAIDQLTADSKVLIAEACTHAPLEEDIGREKIPRMLRKRFGEDLQVNVVAGSEFPDDLSDYDLIIHCGACMFNRRHVLSRIAEAQAAGVAITNYGITMAKLNGILDKIRIPE
ncbi:[FeFe] hydrogenase H-cluster maturation GTPase HydF [Anaerovorax odorimutans]|uniref:[FeFe] hydrogenase H-cluster maturation GTPase HydF n=1 Tax=Anaerovorax odorimutans TaxID=109327 RepID=A0ABT1RSZ8_9FIRM|nr:[FeFe] hydrogenase H-cluster maturation GTPase HydF [Anaerovorax odorimutans]MCQ4638331.1 [FeFe] hydrogenase H-cluster maturation GTPase HydF [Anaerovorax odorimutans]